MSDPQMIVSERELESIYENFNDGIIPEKQTVERMYRTYFKMQGAITVAQCVVNCVLDEAKHGNHSIDTCITSLNYELSGDIDAFGILDFDLHMEPENIKRIICACVKRWNIIRDSKDVIKNSSLGCNEYGKCLFSLEKAVADFG